MKTRPSSSTSCASSMTATSDPATAVTSPTPRPRARRRLSVVHSRSTNRPSAVTAWMASATTTSGKRSCFCRYVGVMLSVASAPRRPTGVQAPLAASTAPMRTRAPLLNWTLLGSFVLNMLSSSSGEPRGFEVDAPRQEALRGADGFEALVAGHAEAAERLGEGVVVRVGEGGSLELVEDVRGLVDGGCVE